MGFFPVVGGVDLTNWLGWLVGDPEAALYLPAFLGLSEEYRVALSVSALGFSTTMTFLMKMTVIILSYMWIRATEPRFRYDQLMRFGWKVLLPVGLALVLLTAVIVVLLPVKGDMNEPLAPSNRPVPLVKSPYASP